MPDRCALRISLGKMVVGVGLVTGTVVGATTVETRAAEDSAVVPAAPQVSDAQLLEDFCHYVLIANHELAKANAQALLDRKLEPAKMMAIVEDSVTMQERFDRAYRRALLVPDLEPLAGALNRIYEDGRLSRARNPQEIAKNIAMLTGNPRANLLGRQRLVSAGEYAVPQLLEVLLTRQNQALQTEATAVLISMGRQAVSPLCTALTSVDPATQETLAKILGRIGYPQALPFLTEVLRTTSSDAVRKAAAEAIKAAGGQADGEVSVASLYRALGEQYYTEQRSITSFPGESHQLVWSFKPQLGLQPTGVVSEIYHEGMAMEMARRALKQDPSDQEAAALWLAANLKREIEQPEDYENPLYGAERRDAMYYAVAAGPTALQSVLGRALEDRDTRLARRAIEALSRCAGAAGLTGGNGSSLVRALSYPDRRVRFEAALALGKAQPREYFEGAERVVPILAGTLRDADKRYAAVISNDIERQQALRSVAEEMGYEVLPPATALADLEASISEIVGLDLMLVDVPSETAVGVIEEARRTARLQATPTFALFSSAGLTQFGGQFEGDKLTSLGREGLAPDSIKASVESLVERASGKPMTEEEARGYAERSLTVLHDLAVGSGGTGSAGAFEIADSAVPLTWALENTQDDLRLKVSDVLSYISLQRVQVSLMDAAMSAEGEERLSMMGRVNDSAKRFGNMLEDRQVRWLLDRAEQAQGDEATMAAALIGSLNLSNDKLVPLLVGGG